LILGIESSCDETGVGLVTPEGQLLGHALHSQVAMHAEYGGVVPELASRDHIRRVFTLTDQVLRDAKVHKSSLTAVAYTQGPGLAGALLVGAAAASALAFGLGVPAVGVHHLEGHMLAPLLSERPPAFPFVALLVSGGHTQLMAVEAFGKYTLLGETLDDAAGEAFDKTAKLLGLGYPGGPALSRLADSATVEEAAHIRFPRPMLHSGNLDFSFSGLKTAVLTATKRHAEAPNDAWKRPLAAGFQAAVVEVLSKKSLAALKHTGYQRLVVAGGVGANRALRAALAQAAARDGFELFFPDLDLCTDNGAMIALAGAMRLRHAQNANSPAQASAEFVAASSLTSGKYTIRPSWLLA
jgi:N6-L-threonylcarbamoyladenine synthase